MNGIVVETDRLVVRPWCIEEADVLFGMRSHPAVARWMADTTPWADRRQADDLISSWASERRADPTLGTWAIVARATGVAVGSVSLRPLPNGDGEIEIGWALMWPGNGPSARVCRAIGMRDLGVRPDPWYGGDSRTFVVSLSVL